ncbi:MAG: spermidine/putrescine ABC transporter ATP-binding protein [Rhizobiales bacterium PAR1]|nr:MAG: spermidine/putrescine ABC transporter ATP-binding protein [Rhizobiales bacterium PAR1]
MQNSVLEVAGAEKAFGSTTVLSGVDLAVENGEFISLLGPSGCGKTTLLRIVAGLLSADRGTVKLSGADITGLPTHMRGVGVVFQNYALFPHLTVAQNVAFGLKAQQISAGDIRATVAKYLDLVQLTSMADRPIRGLSGGQQQRVAVARALAVSPKLLLLDEPFSALDRKLRELMQIELKRILREVGITTVLVTHDQEEALVMSDRIAVMNKGAIEQFAAPGLIYQKPASRFVLDFVGHSTRIAGTTAKTTDGLLAIETAFGTLHAQSGYIPGSPVTVAIRPERISMSMAQETPPSVNVLSARLTDIIFQGSKYHLLFENQGDSHLLVEAGRIPEGMAVGANVHLHWSLEDTLVFPGAQE